MVKVMAETNIETSQEVEQAIEEALDGKPRADELAEMVAALQVRRATFEREREGAIDEARRKEWTSRIKEADKQIALLRQEQAITDFVERSVRVAANRAGLGDPDADW
jgi:hypothetical protein